MITTVFSEGTRQTSPVAGQKGWLCIDKSRNDFAFFGTSPDFKLNICIANLTEKFYYGLGKLIQNDTMVEVHYQIRDPAGNIIMGPEPVPKSGQGFIDTYQQAYTGPFPASGGYNPRVCYPTMAGNYSIEFYYPPDKGTQYTYFSYITFDYFDITVVNAANQPITGRIWSKAWQFNCGMVQHPPSINRFYGTMFILSDDSIVTSINSNGFIGGTFSISSNQTGCSATGNIVADRQSRPGFVTYPQYKVFLSDPDSLIFPTGKARPGVILPVTTTSNCSTGAVDLGIKVNQDGNLEVLIEVDPNPGADPADVVINANVLANPGGNGYNLIHWNGIDGLGKQVANGTMVTATIRFIHGITHLPIYDIEYNDNGYIVEVVRPSGPKPDIYWDDSQLGDNGTIDLNGCNDVLGCHLWDYELGDTNTINSWWYVASSTLPSFSFMVTHSPDKPVQISGNGSFCKGGETRSYSIKKVPNATTCQWSYSGTGATISANDTLATVSFSVSATSGNLSVSGYNPECGNGPTSSLPVVFHPPPVVTVDPMDTLCYNQAAISLQVGNPPGGSYMIDGTSVNLFDPGLEGAGKHELIYLYTDSFGCMNSDSISVFVRTGQACEIFMWVPDAFTPNGDGLNDIYKPVSANVNVYLLQIFNRNGAMIFSSTHPGTGWDGTYNGANCPAGTYIYRIVYQSQHVPPKNTTLTGNITLVR